MSEYLNTNETRQLLNRSLGQLDQTTLASLRKAREEALARHAAGEEARWKFGPRRRVAVTWLATLLIMVSVFGGITYYWQQTHDNGDTDVAILTDDMPVEVYVN